MGRRDYLTKFFFFYLVGSPKVAGAGDGKHTQKYGHPDTNVYIQYILSHHMVLHVVITVWQKHRLILSYCVHYL